MGILKKVLTSFLIVTFLMVSSTAMAGGVDRPDGAAMIIDIPVRVVGLGLTIVGLAVFIPTLIFTAFGEKGSIGAAWDGLVVEPAEFTFVRPLGQFDDWRNLESGDE